MAKYSEEGNSAGFGWFDANIVRFNVSDSIKYKVPHTGWNTIMQVKDSLLFEGINSDSEFCFVHSYHIHCNDKEDIVAETIYDYVFASAIQKNNLFGVQFHPEKSHDVGEMMLRNFVEL
jgi:glutamine amidotransferase